jgi:EXLDI family protein
MGRPLGKVRPRDPEHNRLSRLVVYQTAGGRYAVYIRTWSHWQGADASRDDADWEEESRLDIYEDQHSLRAAIPPDLWAAVAQALSGDAVEELDI